MVVVQESSSIYHYRHPAGDPMLRSHQCLLPGSYVCYGIDWIRSSGCGKWEDVIWAEFEAFTVVMFQADVFWVVTVSHHNTIRRHNPEDGGSMYFWNVCILPQHYTVSQPRRPGLEISIVSSRLVGWLVGRLFSDAILTADVTDRQRIVMYGQVERVVFDVHLKQWYSTGGTRRHLRGYVKFKISIYILFHEWSELQKNIY
jgi:hypothetical protein